MATIIPEQDVSIGTLHALLDRAFFRSEVDEDGELYVTGGIDFAIWIGPQEDNSAWDRLTGPSSFVGSAMDPVAVRRLLVSHDSGRRAKSSVAR